jgi:hypothetical protein
MVRRGRDFGRRESSSQDGFSRILKFPMEKESSRLGVGVGLLESLLGNILKLKGL